MWRLPLLVFLFGSALAGCRSPKNALAPYGCLSADLSWTDAEGRRQEGQLLLVSYADAELPLRWGKLFWLSAQGDNAQLTPDAAPLSNVHGMSISPDGRYLAIETSGEGHPWIDVYDLRGILRAGEWDILRTLNPYPGSIAVRGWQGQHLLLESDIDLQRLARGEDLSFEALTEKPQRFRYDPESDTYSR